MTGIELKIIDKGLMNKKGKIIEDRTDVQMIEIVEIEDQIMIEMTETTVMKEDEIIMDRVQIIGSKIIHTEIVNLIIILDRQEDDDYRRGAPRTRGNNRGNNGGEREYKK